MFTVLSWACSARCSCLLSASGSGERAGPGVMEIDKIPEGDDSTAEEKLFIEASEEDVPSIIALRQESGTPHTEASTPTA